MTYPSSRTDGSVAANGARRGLVKPPEPLTEPPEKCGHCGSASVFAKFMEAIGMLRGGVGLIPYRCVQCAREVFVKVDLPKRQSDFVWEHHAAEIEVDDPCDVCGEPIGLAHNLQQKRHTGCFKPRDHKARLPTSRPGYEWPKEKIELLVSLWNANEETREIAPQLGIKDHRSVNSYVFLFRSRGYNLHFRKNRAGRKQGGWLRPGIGYGWTGEHLADSR